MEVAVCKTKNEKSVESICRLCFMERDHYRSIFEDEYSTLAERIENLTTLKINNVPNTPASLCSECESTLRNFESFREMCFTNDRVIREMFSNDDSKSWHASLLIDIPVIEESETDQSEELQTYSLVSSVESHVNNSDMNIEVVRTLSSNNIDVSKKKQKKIIHDAKTLLNIRKVTPRTSKVSGKKKRYFCSFCGKGFGYTTHLKMHIRSHTQERPHKCEECGKAFITSSCLKVHMRIHNGIKPFSCDRCEWTFTQSSSLIRHKKIHLMKNLMRGTSNDDDDVQFVD